MSKPKKDGEVTVIKPVKLRRMPRKAPASPLEDVIVKVSNAARAMKVAYDVVAPHINKLRGRK